MRLLCERGAAIDHVNSRGNTPLLASCDQGYTGCALLLCDRGAAIDQVNCYGYTPGCTPLLAACASGHTDVAQLLCERGAAIGSALAIARSKGHAACVRVLEAAAAAKAEKDKAVLAKRNHQGSVISHMVIHVT